jgi:SAM-dependent methyltransferase
MRSDAIVLEETRLEKVTGVEDYPAVHERHRIFPAVFENRNHRRILDTSAGIGVVASRIKKHYPAEIVCNEISPKCLSSLKACGLPTVTFDLDDPAKPFPIPDGSYDAAISLATLEHLVNTEHFIGELNRILAPGGALYLSAPNYSGLPYLIPFILNGKTFHDPLSEKQKYEFFAHVRYFTYRTMVELVGSMGFVPDSVYLPVPKESSKFLALRAKRPLTALLVRAAFKALYTCFSPRWASEPVICFRKASGPKGKIRKVVM